MEDWSVEIEAKVRSYAWTSASLELGTKSDLCVSC